MPRRLKPVVAGAIATLLVTCAACGFVVPEHPIGAATWAIAVFASLFGLGGWLRRWLGVELDLGEQIVAGMGVWIAGSGILLAFGLASRAPLLVLALAGIVEVGFELVAWGRKPWRDGRIDRERGVELAFLTVVTVFLALNLLGTLGGRGNPADDQASYTALVKRVLDCGDLIEPFSFRRLSAYGGQTMLQALAALRGDVGGFDLLDAGMFEWIGVIMTIQLARRRGVPVVLTILLTVVLLSLWDLRLNSGATWTGYVGFLAAYAFATREDLPARARWILVFATLGATCTLRQNYLVPAGLFGCLLLLQHFRELAQASSWKDAWTRHRGTLFLAVGVAGLVVVPYMVAAWRSSGTFLYPIIAGTANPAVPLQPTGGTLLDELTFISEVILLPEPIRVWWLLVPAMVLAKDPRQLRPWRAYLISCAVGFALLVHAFQLSDAWNLWRYAFGYLTPLAVVFAIEVARHIKVGETKARPDIEAIEAIEAIETVELRLPAIAALLVWLALVVNLIETRTATSLRFRHALTDIKSAWLHGSTSYDPRIPSYAALQDAIPQGATVAIMLDDPWALDFARNHVFNLDLPGLAAPAPGLPSFTTVENWRSYFAARGIRYLAFVDPAKSSFLFRRAHWVQRMYRDDELYQHISARMVDALDAFVALAKTSTVLFERDGLWALDLGTTSAAEPDRGPPERARMDAFMRATSERELGLTHAWQLANRSTVVFKNDGLGPTPLVLPHIDDLEPEELVMPATVVDYPHRWLVARTRVRVFGTGREAVHVKLWVRIARSYTVPTIVLSIDGQPVVQAEPDADGFVILDAPAACVGWCDLYLVFNSPFDWWIGAEPNGVAQLLEFEWASR